MPKPRKPYRVLKQFSGSQDGSSPGEVFEPGTEPLLTDHLAKIALADGCVEGPIGPEVFDGESILVRDSAGKPVKRSRKPATRKKAAKK